jgi:hypothetical protein
MAVARTSEGKENVRLPPVFLSVNKIMEFHNRMFPLRGR